MPGPDKESKGGSFFKKEKIKEMLQDNNFKRGRRIKSGAIVRIEQLT